jgi:hypothetical protein
MSNHLYWLVYYFSLSENSIFGRSINLIDRRDVLVLGTMTAKLRWTTVLSGDRGFSCKKNYRGEPPW